MAISPELILGLWGSVTGTVSVLILVLRYLKEKPEIEAEIIDSTHYYQPRGEKKKDYFLTFYVETRVKNKGDKGTTIGYADLDFTIGKEDYRLTQSQIFDYDGRRVRVGPSDMVEVRPGFEFLSSYDKNPKQEEIPFTLTLHHSKDTILKGVSKIGS